MHDTPNQPDVNVPAEDAELARIDQMLSLNAKRVQPPAGLAHRTFHASAGMLPAGPALKFAPASHPRNVRSLVSRLAVAASVVLAVIVTIVMVRIPLHSPSGSNVVMDSNGDANGSIAAVRHEGSRAPQGSPLSAAREFVLLDSMQLSYYSEVRGSSHSDLTHDLAQVVRELEM